MGLTVEFAGRYFIFLLLVVYLFGLIELDFAWLISMLLYCSWFVVRVCGIRFFEVTGLDLWMSLFSWFMWIVIWLFSFVRCVVCFGYFCLCRLWLLAVMVNCVWLFVIMRLVWILRGIFACGLRGFAMYLVYIFGLLWLWLLFKCELFVVSDVVCLILVYCI